MKLDWCKLLHTELCWMSDNFTAFTRVVKWYYYSIKTIQPDTLYIEANISINKQYKEDTEEKHEEDTEEHEDTKMNTEDEEDV